MDGRELIYNFRQLLGEESTSTFLDNKSIYTFLNEGATEVAEKTGVLHAEQSITTVADQTAYNLNANYLGLRLKDDNGNWIIKYNDGTNNSFPTFKRYDDVISEDNTTSISIPNNFTINEKLTLFDRVTGTTTSAGAIDTQTSESTLTDTAATFSTDGVQPGDIVHNTTSGSIFDGYVIEVTSETALVTAMFNVADTGSTTKGWGSGDTYSIQPQGRKTLVLDPPPSTASHTITMYQRIKPPPVYSDFRTFRFSDNYNMAAIYFALAMFKYRDQKQKEAATFIALGDKKIREINTATKSEFHKGRTMHVNLKKRRI